MHTFEYRDAAAVCLRMQLRHAQDRAVKRNKCYFTILIIYQSRKKDNTNEDAKTSKARPDKKPDLHRYNTEDKDALVEERLESREIASLE